MCLQFSQPNNIYYPNKKMKKLFRQSNCWEPPTCPNFTYDKFWSGLPRTFWDNVLKSGFFFEGVPKIEKNQMKVYFSAMLT